MVTDITNNQLQNMLRKYPDNIKVNFVTDAQNIFVWYGMEKPDWAIRVEQCTPDLLNLYIAEYNKPVSDIATLKQSIEQKDKRVSALEEALKMCLVVVKAEQIETDTDKESGEQWFLKLERLINHSEQLLNKEG